ncbi:hypothetical protein F444_01880 [Phytophthora nicotianae P1976]|uniref:Uncharacterized protein n=1 Tax=Phytophthora nicotianae P1976 TaxID=1317066 RepID=A0A081AZ65_PHYNI|nr:hypothetical protein F444_01880 [Phytophthora nicotianae P1976]
MHGVAGELRTKTSSWSLRLNNVILHGEVQPFPQQIPVTDAQKAVLNYKPQLKIEDGCHPHPAVQKDGATSGGLSWSGPQDGECKGRILKSTLGQRGSRTSGPSCTPAAAGWAKEAPPPEKYLDGNSLKVAYYYNHIYGNTAVKYTDETGEFQDLITWNR